MSAPEPVANPGDWCSWLRAGPGKFSSGDANPFIQEFKLVGRFHWQAAYLDGRDANGYGFSDAYTDVRRFRLGAETKALQHFGFKAIVNLVDDFRADPSAAGPREIDWGYQDFDEALVSFDLKSAFGISALDGLSLTYGRHKFLLSQEAHASSNKLLTVERSSISNKVYGGYRPTGVSLAAEKGAWETTVAVFSTDEAFGGGNVEFLGGWNDGLAWYLSVGFQPAKTSAFRWDFIYNDADATRGEDSLWNYRWATSFSAEFTADRCGLILDAIYGDNGGPENGVTAASRQGNFWGLVIMPYYWIVEDKLQGVLRYQYAGSDGDQGTRLNSRYIRRDHGPVVDASTYGGRGNENHALYAGVNYLICGHNLKVQAGLEYDWLNIPGAGTKGDLSALTWWFGFRSHF